MIDLSKLTPAPWLNNPGDPEVTGPTREDMVIYDEGGHGATDGAFIALARNAFDVMMRRGWQPRQNSKGWRAWNPDDEDYMGHDEDGYFYWPDPFTALVEGDKFNPEEPKNA